MNKLSNKSTLIVELVIYIGFIVFLSLILNSVFSGVVIGRTPKPDRELIYSLSNHLLPKILISLGILISVGLTSLTTFKLIGKIDLENEKINLTELITLVLLTLILIVPIIIFDNKLDDYNGYSFGFSLALLIITMTLITVKTINIFFKKSEEITIQSLAEGAILGALAVVLGLLSKLLGLELPNGGSFSLSMLPLIIYGFRRGAKMGFIMGFTYGLINFITDGQVLHWGSIFFDYLIPFGLVAFIPGLLRKKAQKGSYLAIILGAFLAGFARYIFHGLSGVIFFSEYAGEVNPWLYSFILYNLPYMAISTVASLVFTVLLSKNFIIEETKIR